MRVNLGRLP
jgi:hypothetical protein